MKTYKISFEFSTDNENTNPLNWIADSIYEQLENNETCGNFQIEEIETTNQCN